LKPSLRGLPPSTSSTSSPEKVLALRRGEPRDGVIEIRVVDASTAKPVAGAAVLWRHLTHEWLGGTVPTGDVISRFRADSAGVCVLPRPVEHAADVGLVVSSRGYKTATALVGDEQLASTLLLQPLESIHGIVLDADGMPQADARVSAHNADYSGAAAGRVASQPMEPSSAFSQAVTDEQGRFSIPVEAGWSWLRAATSDSSARSRAVLWSPATGRVELRVHPIRVFHVELVDAETGQDFTQHGPLLVTASPKDARAQLVLHEFFAIEGQTVSTIIRDDQFDRGFVGVVRGSTAEDVTLTVSGTGFVECAATVHLMRPRNLLGHHQVDRIRVAGIGRAETGQIVVSTERPHQPVAPPANQPYVFSVVGPTDGAAKFWQVVGTRTESGWVFGGIPTGRHRVILNDGFGSSSPFDVDVRPGTTATYQVDLPAATGMTLAVKRRDGRRLWGGAVVVQPIDGPNAGRAAWDLSEATQFPPLTAGNGQRFVPLPGGAYKLEVSHTGYQSSSRTIELVPGQFSAITVVLDPKK